jgi:hypothetical protein
LLDSIYERFNSLLKPSLYKKPCALLPQKYRYRLSIDTHFENRTILILKSIWRYQKKNLKSIFDSNFIVYRNDSRNPGNCLGKSHTANKELDRICNSLSVSNITIVKICVRKLYCVMSHRKR